MLQGLFGWDFLGTIWGVSASFLGNLFSFVGTRVVYVIKIYTYL